VFILLVGKAVVYLNARVACNEPGQLSWYRDGLPAGRPIGERGFSLLYSVQTGSGAHTALYTLGTVGRGVNLTIHLSLEPMSKMMEL
jgi:hypothetical protein